MENFILYIYEDEISGFGNSGYLDFTQARDETEAKKIFKNNQEKDYKYSNYANGINEIKNLEQEIKRFETKLEYTEMQILREKRILKKMKKALIK